jgi:hypothetical protein
MNMWTGLNWRSPAYTGLPANQLPVITEQFCLRSVTCSLEFCVKLSNSLYFPSSNVSCIRNSVDSIRKLSKTFRLSRKNNTLLSVTMGSDLVLINKYGRISKHTMLPKYVSNLESNGLVSSYWILSRIEISVSIPYRFQMFV